MLRLKNSSPPQLGIALYINRVEYALLCEQTHGYKTLSCGHIITTQQQKHEALAYLLQQTKKNIKLFYKGKHIRTIITLSNQLIAHNIIHVADTLSDPEIYLHLCYQAESIFKQTAHAGAIDYCIEYQREKQFCVHAYAAQRQLIQSIQQLANYNKFKLKAIDVEQLAIARAIPLLNNYQSRYSYLLFIVNNSESLLGSFTYPVFMIHQTMQHINKLSDTVADLLYQRYKMLIADQQNHLILFAGYHKQLTDITDKFNQLSGEQASLAQFNTKIITYAANYPSLAAIGSVLWGSRYASKPTSMAR